MYKKFNFNNDEDFYDRFVRIYGEALVDFEEIGHNEFYVLRKLKDAQDKPEIFCTRVLFVARPSSAWRKFEEGYEFYFEYCKDMGAKPLSERLFNKLTKYIYNTLDKNNAAYAWRKAQQENIIAKKKLKLRIGDIIRIEPALKCKVYGASTLVKEIKCISINPLRFSIVTVKGCMEEYIGSVHIHRTAILQRNPQFLNRGKPCKKRNIEPFNEEEHLAKIAKAIEKQEKVKLLERAMAESW